MDWYKEAVFYELHVRAFHDSNGDGIGDFPGLLEKLPYLEKLGVNALWLLPFYVSPLEDDGYDIADFKAVHPSYGTIDDFRRCLDEAHARGIRIVCELVINHTSDRHPWFQEARKDARSPRRDYYVWSDTDQRYPKARVIFTDTERSNWTWDPAAKAYYWHRFFSHQPDLNFDHPPVREEIKEVIRFWLGLGVDGLRVDAVPYLFEREGTSCENLPETHAFVKELRRLVDAEFPGRMLLAEANQWPEDLVAYFGSGDEFHMAFNFPLMPRIFMAVRREERRPIEEILERTPRIPESCQWAIFLRNHDELTLEMVTDQERDYMYGEYATDQRSRLNLGIRRRLAPLLDDSRRKIELMNALLLTLPGTPIIYYGDEIGMGDNVYLGDRNGVRTPMQWTCDRNAGFSRCDPAALYAPVIVDPVFGHATRNVESQERHATSLLCWMRRMLALRRANAAVFGRGSIDFLRPENPRVLAFLRSHGEETILCVNNLSRFVQPCELDLSRFVGATPVELIGGSHFPAVERRPYFLSLGPHGFYWFRLVRRSGAA
ncbi:maltose alpha-D-glucosyltransferase [bacterium]|nr:maltose alpha-D-glucosyltransferase [bacterium]